MATYYNVKESSSCELLGTGPVICHLRLGVKCRKAVGGFGCWSLYFSTYNVINTHIDSELLLVLMQCMELFIVWCHKSHSREIVLIKIAALQLWIVTNDAAEALDTSK